MYFVCHAIFYKSSFNLSRRTGTNREGIRVRSYNPGSATEQIRFGAKAITVCPGYATVYGSALPV